MKNHNLNNLQNQNINNINNFLISGKNIKSVSGRFRDIVLYTYKKTKKIYLRSYSYPKLSK